MQYVPPLGATDPNASYVEGNPSAGIRGSYPTATGYEAMMREICNAIAAGGLTPDPTNLAQLGAVIQAAITGPGEGVSKTNGLLSLNFSGLSENDTVSGSDVIAFWQVNTEGGEVGGHHRKATMAALGAYLATLQSVLAPGEGVGIGANQVSLAFPSLAEDDSIHPSDVFAYYNATDVHHRKTTFANLAVAVLATLSGASGGSSLAAPAVRIPRIFAWGNIDSTSGSPILRDGSGISSIVNYHNGEGGTIYVINFTNALPDTSFTALFSLGSYNPANNSDTAQEVYTARTTSSISVLLDAPVYSNDIYTIFSVMIYHT